MKKKDWLKFKSYTHVTPKINPRKSNWIREYVRDIPKIESHRFFPMIHYTILENRYRRKRIDGIKDKERTPKAKKRYLLFESFRWTHLCILCKTAK